MARKRKAGLAPPGNDDPIDEIFAVARRIDRAAWEDRDRLWAERGVNPDRMDQPAGDAAERRMRDRRDHSIRLAVDAAIAGDDPEIAAALRNLDAASWH